MPFLSGPPHSSEWRGAWQNTESNAVANDNLRRFHFCCRSCKTFFKLFSYTRR